MEDEPARAIRFPQESLGSISEMREQEPVTSVREVGLLSWSCAEQPDPAELSPEEARNRGHVKQAGDASIEVGVCDICAGYYVPDNVSKFWLGPWETLKTGFCSNKHCRKSLCQKVAVCQEASLFVLYNEQRVWHEGKEVYTAQGRLEWSEAKSEMIIATALPVIEELDNARSR